MEPANVSKTTFPLATTLEHLCCYGACGSEVMNYEWTEGLDWLLDIAPPLDIVQATVNDDHLDVESSDSFWDDEDWANGLESAQLDPMAQYNYEATANNEHPTRPSSLSSSFTEFNGADNVSTLPPPLKSDQAFSEERSVSPDINGNCITISETIKSSITTSGIRIIPAMDKKISARLVAESGRRRTLRALRVHPEQQRHSLPLRLQFPNLESSLNGYLAYLIRTAKSGEGEVQRVAEKELESLTMSTIQKRLFEMVPGLEDRGISHTSIHRLLQPLTMRDIRSCLRDSSAWCIVNEVIVI